AVINTPDVGSIYEVPLIINQENVGEYIINRIKIDAGEQDLTEWEKVVESLKQEDYQVSVGIIGKYVELEDAYMSIRESLKHAGANLGIKVNIEWIQAENIIDEEKVSHLDSLLIPGGFGERGISGKLDAVRYSLQNKVPLFGICLGMQCAVIEYARNVLGWQNANSTEFNPSAEYPVISLLEEQMGLEQKGGTMRLGGFPALITENTLAHKEYGATRIRERHRHRFEFTYRYRAEMEKAGLIFSGISPDKQLVEIVELKQSQHPWFLGCQFHPEFQSKPTEPNPLFAGFVRAAAAHAKEHEKKEKKK
ncbi:MAG: CTP synthase, partial [Spirochaetae bacterium HGW-Spirochaetae-10]